MRDYRRFIRSKAIAAPEVGFEPRALPSLLYPFQREIVATRCRIGRSAVFAECGLGKTPMQLSWAHAVSEHAKGRVLILAPLAVAQQTVREGEKFGLPVRYAQSGEDVKSDVVVTNYERLKSFDPTAFAGIVLDESSILKAYSGSTKRRLVEAFASTPYRLACSATPAPNDHLELGNHSEFLSVLTSHQMIARWFLADQDAGEYRLKGHAVEDFWDWVSSWAAMCALPSDIHPQFSDEGYILPPLNHRTHVVDVDMIEGRGATLFRIPELSATSVHAERRRTAKARAERVAELVRAEPHEPWVIWTETDYEADELAACLPEAVELRGGEDPKRKEDTLLAFSDGLIRVLISKPKIAGFGLNWQHCAPAATPSRQNGTSQSGGSRSPELGKSGLARMMLCLAQAGPDGLSLSQLAVRSRIARKGGTFRTYLGAGKTKGWISEQGGRCAITGDGLAALGPFEPRDGNELDSWLAEFGDSGAARMLRELAAAGEAGLTLDDLSERTNIARAGGTFRTYLGKLKTLELANEGEGVVCIHGDLL